MDNYGLIMYIHENEMIIEELKSRPKALSETSLILSDIFRYVFYKNVDIRHNCCKSKKCPHKNRVFHIIIYESNKSNGLDCHDIDFYGINHINLTIHVDDLKIEFKGNEYISSELSRVNQFYSDILTFRDRIKAKNKNQIKAYIKEKMFDINPSFKLLSTLIKQTIECEKKLLLDKHNPFTSNKKFNKSY